MENNKVYVVGRYFSNDIFLCLNKSDAEDIVQITFARLYKNKNVKKIVDLFICNKFLVPGVFSWGSDFIPLLRFSLEIHLLFMSVVIKIVKEKRTPICQGCAPNF